MTSREGLHADGMRRAAELAYWAKQDAANAGDLDGYSQQLLECLTVNELKEMALISSNTAVRLDVA
jgi:hypothetical protein